MANELLDASIKRRRHLAAARMNPMAARGYQSTLDQESKAYGKTMAKRFSSGRHTATETGAKGLAKERGDFRSMGEMAKSLTAGTKEAEEFIRSGRYKRGGA